MPQLGSTTQGAHELGQYAQFRTLTSHSATIATSNASTIALDNAVTTYGDVGTAANQSSISLDAPVTSHAQPSTTSNSRVIAVVESVTSHGTAGESLNSRVVYFPRNATTQGEGGIVVHTDPTDALDGTPQIEMYWDDRERAYVTEWFEERSFLAVEDRDIVITAFGEFTEDGIAVTPQRDVNGDGRPEQTGETIRITTHNIPVIYDSRDLVPEDGQYRFVFRDIGLDDHFERVEIAFTHGRR